MANRAWASFKATWEDSKATAGHIVITICTMAKLHWPRLNFAGMLWFPDLTFAAWAGFLGKLLTSMLWALCLRLYIRIPGAPPTCSLGEQAQSGRPQPPLLQHGPGLGLGQGSVYAAGQGSYGLPVGCMPDPLPAHMPGNLHQNLLS